MTRPAPDIVRPFGFDGRGAPETGAPRLAVDSRHATELDLTGSDSDTIHKQGEHHVHARFATGRRARRRHRHNLDQGLRHPVAISFRRRPRQPAQPAGDNRYTLRDAAARRSTQRAASHSIGIHSPYIVND